MLEDIKVNSERWFDLTPLKNELWRNIKDFEGCYQVSNYGRVKNLERLVWNRFAYVKIPERILTARYTKKGYVVYILQANDKKISKKAHWLVLETFVKNVDNKSQINHKNTIKDDNRLFNLEYCTNQENVKHAFENGLHKGKHRIYKYNKKQLTEEERKQKQIYILNKYRQQAIKLASEKNKKKLLQYSIEGEFIKEWNGFREAERYYGKRIHFGRKSSLGYVWKYKEE